MPLRGLRCAARPCSQPGAPPGLQPRSSSWVTREGPRSSSEAPRGPPCRSLASVPPAPPRGQCPGSCGQPLICLFAPADCWRPSWSRSQAERPHTGHRSPSVPRRGCDPAAWEGGGFHCKRCKQLGSVGVHSHGP